MVGDARPAMEISRMTPHVEIAFDCLPLRSVTRFDVPLDAPDEFQQFCQRVKQATAKHGMHNTYYLHNARCVYHLTNDERIGVLNFKFEGTALTDPDDQKTKYCELQVELQSEACDWLTKSAAEWFRETVQHAVLVEFDRFIAAGDLARTIARMEKLRAESVAHGGFLGMGL
jgi:hypothetical protein